MKDLKNKVMEWIFKFLGYIAMKWILFYGYQYIESGNKWDWNKMQNREDALYTLWMLLALPLLETLILALPFQLALKQKGTFLLLILILVFVLEFAIGWFATNQKFALWMVVKLVLSIGLFFLFYRKQLKF